MGKFNAALLWLGAPLALNFGGLLPWWGVVTWVLSPFIALALLTIGAGVIAAVMDTCTGDRAIRGNSINSLHNPLMLKLNKPQVGPAARQFQRPIESR
jgi:hypothetical protein